MIKRYPHKALIKIDKEIDFGTGINDVISKEIEIICRYQPMGNNENLNYSGKFYTPKNDLEPFEVDGQHIIYQGKSFVIVQLFNYQTHCEIWVE